MRRLATVAAVAALGIWAVLATWSSLDFFAANLHNRDITAFYRSAESWWTIRDLYDVEGIPNVNINPPHVSVLLFVPLLLWPLPVAVVVWFVVQALAGIVALVIIQRELRIPAARWAWIAPAFLASCALQHHWREGQLTGFLLLLSTLAWRSARRNDTGLAPWTAAAISLKPWLACWLPVLTFRRALVTVAMGLGAVLTGVAIFGIDSWTEWSAAVQGKPVRPMVVNLSILAAIGRGLRTTLINDGTGWPYDQPLWVLLAIGAVAVTWRARSGSTDRTWLTFGLAGILVSPLGWAYYLVAITGPLLGWGEAQKWPWPSLVAIGFLLATREFMQELNLYGWFGGSIAFFGVVLLWLTAMFCQQAHAAKGEVRSAYAA